MKRLAWLLPIGLLLGVGSWGVSDHYEAQNAFCTACHLPDGTALHLETRELFERVVPANLAGVHGRGSVEEREDEAFRCIDCHAGSGPVERTKVKLLAARDAVRYALGSFEEPDGMPFELSPATCLGCHPTFRRSAAPGWTVQAYHGSRSTTPPTPRAASPATPSTSRTATPSPTSCRARVSTRGVARVTTAVGRSRCPRSSQPRRDT